MISLTRRQARKLVLLAQRVPPAKSAGPATDATLDVIEHLGYIQIDAISAIQRAHHHTLWNRNPRYKPQHLDELVANKKVFEYWAHAASYLPMRDYRFSLVRKLALKRGEQKHWYQRDERLMKLVVQRIAEEGPLAAKDFEHTTKKVGEWRSKPAKRALEYLFMQGDLMSPYRVNFHKVYDLTERVLPKSVNATPPSLEEYARFLITRYLHANGLGLASEIAYLRKGIKEQVASTAKQMLEDGELLQVRTGDATFFALPESLQLLDMPLARGKLKILSPFDNLVIQRKRLSTLFDFEFLIECYVPAAKRRYGYFCLPILWNGEFVARMDCKADRPESLLHIQHIAIEPGFTKLDALFTALSKEMKSFLRFNQCTNVKLHRTTPATSKPALHRALSDLLS